MASAALPTGARANVRAAAISACVLEHLFEPRELFGSAGERGVVADELSGMVADLFVLRERPENLAAPLNSLVLRERRAKVAKHRGARRRPFARQRACHRIATSGSPNEYVG